MNLFQSVAIASRPCLTQVLRQRSIHSSAALLSDKPPPKTQEAPQEQQEQQEPQEPQEPQGTAPQSAQETDKAEEKIEYIGNTRFPRPRPKPRKTIQPGEAVGQTKPAGKVEHQTFKEQWDQKWRDILSPEKNLETRARIIREIGESHWQNILDLRNNGDKLFQAPTSLISVKGARYLPNLEGRTLAGVDTDIVDLCKGKTTLLTVEFTKFAEKHTNSFIGLFEKAMEGRENVQVVQVNIEENWAKAAVLRMCLPYVRRNIPKNRHATYLVHYGDVEGLRNKMGIANPLIGYVFLVDPKTRIRWYANGEAVQSEGATMLALSEELIRQAKQ